MPTSAHIGGLDGERNIAFAYGKEGYVALIAPLGEDAHHLTGHGADSIYYHPEKDELVIVDNKASGDLKTIDSASAITKNLESTLRDARDVIVEHAGKQDTNKTRDEASSDARERYNDAAPSDQSAGQAEIRERLVDLLAKEAEIRGRAVELLDKAIEAVGKGGGWPSEVKLVVTNAGGYVRGISAKLENYFHDKIDGLTVEFKDVVPEGVRETREADIAAAKEEGVNPSRPNRNQRPPSSDSAVDSNQQQPKPMSHETPTDKPGQAQVEFNKAQGNAWEALVEAGIRRNVHTPEGEVVDGAQRHEFIIRGKDGEPLALVDLKSGEITDPQQIIEQIDAAANTETGTYIIAHRDPEMVLEFLENNPHVLEHAAQSGQNVIIKDLSIVPVPEDGTVKRDGDEDANKTPEAASSDNHDHDNDGAPDDRAASNGGDGQVERHAHDAEDEARAGRGRDQRLDDDRTAPDNEPNINPELKSDSDPRREPVDDGPAPHEVDSHVAGEWDTPIEDLSAMSAPVEAAALAQIDKTDVPSDMSASDATANAETGAVFDGALDAASEAKALLQVMTEFNVLSDAGRVYDLIRDSSAGDQATDGGSGEI